MTRSKVIGGQIVIVILVTLVHILFEQVRLNYNQTWIIGTLRCTMGTLRYDAFRGHMTRSKVMEGQIVSYLTSNCYSYGFPFFKSVQHEQVRSDYNQTWIIDAL